jgi:hypothetical protein
MSSMRQTSSPSATLPEAARAAFWDHDFDALDWREHRDFIIRRVLESGPWEAVVWLRAQLGDDELRAWIERHDGRPLSPQQLRFWQVILDLPAESVDAWLQSPGRTIWKERVRR